MKTMNGLTEKILENFVSRFDLITNKIQISTSSSSKNRKKFRGYFLEEMLTPI